MALTHTSETYVSPSVRSYARGADALADSRNRIATGNRIIRNGDDSTSLTLATRLQSQTSNLRATLQNGAKATSFLQIAYDGLSQIRTILDTLRALTDTANSSGITTRQFATLEAQFQSGKSNIDLVVAGTTFDGASILDGTAAPVIVTGDASGDTISLSIPSVTSTDLFGVAPVSIGDAANAATADTTVSDAQQLVEEAIARVTAYQLQLDTADAATKDRIRGLNNAKDGLIATDKAEESNRADRQELTQNLAAAVIAQTLALNSDLLRLVQLG